MSYFHSKTPILSSYPLLDWFLTHPISASVYKQLIYFCSLKNILIVGVEMVDFAEGWSCKARASQA